MHRIAFACFITLLALTPVSAQVLREFPADAKRGVLEAHEYPNYRIGKITYRISAGGRIRDQQNRIVMPVSLPAQKADVIYRIDINGQLSAIWLLTSDEIKRFPRPPEPKPAKPPAK